MEVVKDAATGKLSVLARTDSTKEKVMTMPLPNAEVLFLRNSKTDYHVDAELWKDYVMLALIPCINYFYPSIPGKKRKVYFVLDNASTHHARTGAQFSPYSSSSSKSQMLAKLKDLGETEVRWTKSNGAAVFSTLAAAGRTGLKDVAPNKDQVADHTYKVLREKHPGLLLTDLKHPGLLLTDLQQMCSASGVELIFTVPYAPKSQPIEMIWGIIKNEARTHYHHKNTSKDVERLIREAYVSMKLVRAVPPPGSAMPSNKVCEGTINASRKWIDEFFIGKHAELKGLKGKIGSLEIPAGSSLAATLASWEADINNLYLLVAEAEGLACVLEDHAPIASLDA